ncbi:MAG TPA: CsgG/HfaB family protein [Bacillota bacterium]|nr:CsgG/HfaB family protein [Bacillota bacterium]
MKRLFLLFLLIFFILAFSVFSAEKLYKIAVLPFDDGSIQDRWWDEGNWDVGNGVSDELITELLKTKKFRLIEREQINKILEEQDFGKSERVDTSSAAKIGKVLGVQFLVMGRVTEFSLKSSEFGGLSLSKGIGLGVKNTTAKVGIDARLVDTSSAEIIASVTGKGNKRNTGLSVVSDWNAVSLDSDEFRQTNLGIALREAVASVAEKLSDEAYKSGRGPALPDKLTGTVAYFSGNKVIINIGSTSGIKPGMVLIVKRVLEVVKDPTTGDLLDEVTEAVAEIKVNEVKEKSATCTVLKIINSENTITVGDKIEQK